MSFVVTRVTPSGLFNGIVGTFSSDEEVVEGIKKYEARQKEENLHFPLTTSFNSKPVTLLPTTTHRPGEKVIVGGQDHYHITECHAGWPVGVPLPDPSAPGYTDKE